MAAKSRRGKGEDPKLDMTPMIDVVFELMIFFVVNLKQEDILTKLNANRPAPNSAPATPSNDDQIKIAIGRGQDRNKGFFTLNDRAIDLAKLEDQLRTLSKGSKKATILIRCDTESPHGALVKVLDICHYLGLENLSIFSMGPDGKQL